MTDISREQMIEAIRKRVEAPTPDTWVSAPGMPVGESPLVMSRYEVRWLLDAATNKGCSAAEGREKLALQLAWGADTAREKAEAALTEAIARVRVLEAENDRPTKALNAGAALIEAVIEWSADRVPGDPSDAELMKAIWRYSGDNTEPCEECDGDCGEPCAPCTVEQACASLDRFSADWRKKRGIIAAISQSPTESAEI